MLCNEHAGMQMFACNTKPEQDTLFLIHIEFLAKQTPWMHSTEMEQILKQC